MKTVAVLPYTFAEGMPPLGLLTKSSNAYTCVRSIHRQATSSRLVLNLLTAFANGVRIAINVSRQRMTVEWLKAHRPGVSTG
jgi:hypothetical protein